MDVLVVRNVTHDAEKAKDKKAALGTDIVIENFSKEEVNAFDVLDDISDVDKKTKRTLLKVGVDTESEERSGSFLQMDQSNVFSHSISDSIELMNTQMALEKYSWLQDYMWKAVKPDADKYTAQTALREAEDEFCSGYFIRSLPGTKEVFPVQACMFIADQDVMQTAHNIIIAEENSELHLITGCATGEDVSSALHVGVSEMYLKPGAKITFTMVHNWAEQVEVRPRTGIVQEKNTTYINNYILTSPVRSIQSYPTTNCNGENARALFQSIQSGVKDSIIDVGSRALLNAPNTSAEIISRAVANEELEANAANLEMSHEAAVGQIDEEEIYYLTSRGLTEEEAASMIVRGFLSMDITGLPDELAAETQRMIDMSLDGM